ncbi:MAG: YajQ family cyclic di-GMP-binding protein [Cyanobacteria bacterium P01_H01_bin.74]
MAKDASFDIVSEFDKQELVNAIDQTKREVQSRFDLKDSNSEVTLEEDKKIILVSTDEFKLKNIYDILESKAIKRGLNPLIFDCQEPESALGGTIRQTILLKKGIETMVAKKIVAHIKDTKLKVQASIQGEQVRVTGKNRDDLQSVIATMKVYADQQHIPLQYNNFR